MLVGVAVAMRLTTPARSLDQPDGDDRILGNHVGTSYELCGKDRKRFGVF